MNTVGLSIIIPTFNEAATISKLLHRIAAAMTGHGVSYEIIVVDDRSGDSTKRKVLALAKKYPVTFYPKLGKRGKGYSILEGYDHAKYDYIAMIDADLQYPPELLPELYISAIETGCAIANRKTYKSSVLRTVASRANAHVFGRLLHGIDADVQSGLKVLHRNAFEHLDRRLISAWAIDIPLLFTAYELGFTARSIDFDFHPRPHGTSSVRFLATAWQIAKGAILTKLAARRIHVVTRKKPDAMLGAGFFYKRMRFITHTTLPHRQSALIQLTRLQKFAVASLVAAFITGIFTNPVATAIVFTAIISAVYFVDVFFNLFVILKSLHAPPEITFDGASLAALDDATLPSYTILCPLYREAVVLPQFVEAIKALDWPKNKLEVLLLLEEDDGSTIEAAKSMDLPPYFRTVVVPHSEPKTKPKAANYGLQFAKGEYVVVYDAEDKPEASQLKKAYLAFGKSDPTVVCMQAKLNYYNPHDNLLTRLFTAEYSLWFDVILPGLQSIRTAIPLGGTSNHFRTADLRKLHGWDPFNVTEDADLGARLFTAGYKTAIIDSTTLEEANSHVRNWFRQRSRWIKGYIQTYFVHFRNPLQFARQYGKHAFLFQLIVGGKIAFMLINPILWGITVSYFAFNALVGPTIESLYPPVIFYMAITSLVMGNFIYLYNYMIGCAKKGHWDLIKYVFFVPFYWLMISWGAGIALIQFILKPYYWEKTVHGLHLTKAVIEKQKVASRLESARNRAQRYARFADILSSKNFLGGGLLVLSSLSANIFNFIYNSYLGRKTNLEDFGVISLLGSFYYIAHVPMSSLGRVVTHKSAYLLGQYNNAISHYWKYIRHKALMVSLIVAGLWLASSPILMVIFKTHDPYPFLLFTPVLVAGTLLSIDNGFLGGNMQFSSLAMLSVLEAGLRVLFSILFIEAGLYRYVYASLPLSLTIVLFIAWLKVKAIKTQELPVSEMRGALSFPKKFFGTSILMSVTGIAYLSFDVILAKFYLSPKEAGSYSLLTLAGKMVYFIGSLFSQFIVPVVSRDMGAGKSSRKTFRLIILLVLTINVLAFIVFGMFGYLTAPLLWGAKAHEIVPYLPIYALSMVAYSLSSTIIRYHHVKGRYIFPILGFVFACTQILGFIISHDSIKSLVEVILITSLISLLGIVFLDRMHSSLAVIYQNFRDFLGLFHRLPTFTDLPKGKKRILIFNWRDLKHKWSGGAEVYIHELAKRWVAKGHKVTVFCGNDGSAKRHEDIDGVQIVRRGGFYLVYVWAFLYYVFKFKNKYDIIIDSENGIPFFTPLYARKKIFLLIHHVHQEVFRKRLKPPWSWFAMFLERDLMPLAYTNTEVITVSPSSKAEILEHRLTKKDPFVIYNGVDFSKCKPGAKSTDPTVLYLGRLTYLKSLNILIRAALRIRKRIPKIRVIIAGDGPEKKKLSYLVKSLGLESVIQFKGKVSEEEKIRLFQEAWVFVNPSLIEGWGITTIEANACGTPVVASNVPGLRDAVHNPHSGLLVPYGNIAEFSKKIIHLLSNTKERVRMSRDAVAWAKKFDWNKSASSAMNLFVFNEYE